MSLRSQASWALSALSIAALGMCLCACTPDAASNGPAVESKAAGEGAASSESNVSRAMVLAVRDGQALFADTETGTVYFPTFPASGVQDESGETVSADDLQPGDIVEVRGNGIMLESYPGQYPGIAKVTVTEKGDPADIAPYQDVIDQVFVEPDPYSPPYASVNYRTALAQASVALDSFSTEWDTEDGKRFAACGSPVDAEGAVLEGVPDVRIDKPREAQIEFSLPPHAASVARKPLSSSDGANEVDPAQAASDVEAELSGKSISLVIEPGYLYTVSADFEHGNAAYAFVAGE